MVIWRKLGEGLKRSEGSGYRDKGIRIKLKVRELSMGIYEDTCSDCLNRTTNNDRYKEKSEGVRIGGVD